MPDTKITDLAALTGANLASGDKFPAVDISDTSMAASGTDVSLTATQLAIGLATTLGIVGIDKIWDAAGDLAVGSGADAATRLAVGTIPGTALAADPGATPKVSWNFVQSIQDAKSGTTSTTLASTFDRAVISDTNTALLSTGRLGVVAIYLPKGMTINNITFWSASTALVTGTNQWFALFDKDKNKLAVTADDTSTAWAANTAKSLVISGGFLTTYSGLYYLGIMVKATTVPTISTTASLGAIIVRTGSGGNFLGGVADSGLTNPASCPNPYTAVSTQGPLAYAEVS